MTIANHTKHKFYKHTYDIIKERVENDFQGKDIELVILTKYNPELRCLAYEVVIDEGVSHYGTVFSTYDAASNPKISNKYYRC